MTVTKKHSTSTLRVLLAAMAVVICCGCTSRWVKFSVEVHDRSTDRPINEAVITVDAASMGLRQRGCAIERTSSMGVANVRLRTADSAFLIAVYVQGHDRHTLLVTDNQARPEHLRTTLGGATTLDVQVTISEQEDR